MHLSSRRGMAALANASSKFEKIAPALASLNPTWQQTMLRIRDPKESVEFYKKNFGMTVLNEYHFGPEKGAFSIYCLGTLPTDKITAGGLPALGTKEAQDLWFNTAGTLELTHNHGTEKMSPEEFKVVDHAQRKQLYANGNTDPRGFGHIAFNTRDVYKTCETLEQNGVLFKKKPDEGMMKGLAFALDPDGYWIEIVKGDQEIEPDRLNLSQTMIRIKDPETSVPFYQHLFNMALMTEKHFPPEKGDFSLYFFGSKTKHAQDLIAKNAPEPVKKLWDPVLELTWNHGTEKQEGPVYHNGSDTEFNGEKVARGFGHIGFVVDDLDKYCELLQSVDVSFTKLPSQGMMRGIAFCRDPTGYLIEIIQRDLPPFQ